MKKIVILLSFIFISGIIFGQSKFPNGISSSIAEYDYVISKRGSVYYATGRALTSYSNADATVVINNAIGQLTTGGSIFIKRGLYDGLSTIVVTYNNITIEGEDRYLTKLKLKASADAGALNGHLFYCGGPDGFTLRNIDLDGNGLNQTKVNNRGGTDIAMSIGVCLRDSVSWGYTNNILIENCYIHDFAARGIVWGKGDRCTITNCDFNNNFTAHMEFWGETTNGETTNCTSKNGCFMTFFECSNHTMSNCRILYPYNAQFHHNDEFAITLEATGYGPDNISISDVTIQGDTISKAIYLITNGLRNLSIDNVKIISSDPDGYGITTEKDTNTVISNCRIIGTKYPIITLGSQSATISNNHIDGNPIGGYCGIYLDGSSDSINVMNNYIKMQGGRPIELVAGATDNIITGNILDGIWGDSQIIDAGTGTVIFNNYSLLTDSKLPDKTSNILNTGTITDATGITVAMLNEIIYYNEVAATDISANPQIVDGRNGQKITIIGSSDANTLTLDDGNGLQLAGAAQCVLGVGDTITLIYSSGLDIWVEVSRSNN